MKIFFILFGEKSQLIRSRNVQNNIKQMIVSDVNQFQPKGSLICSSVDQGKFVLFKWRHNSHKIS